MYLEVGNVYVKSLWGMNMNEQKNRIIQKQQQIWISKSKKEVFFSEVREYECVEFKKYEDLMEYIKVCVECGYKVG